MKCKPCGNTGWIISTEIGIDGIKIGCPYCTRYFQMSDDEHLIEQLQRANTFVSCAAAKRIEQLSNAIAKHRDDFPDETSRSSPCPGVEWVLRHLL